VQHEEADAGSTAIISAATRRRSAVPAPRRSPAKIMGSAEGRITLRMTLQRRAPKATAFPSGDHTAPPCPPCSKESGVNRSAALRGDEWERHGAQTSANATARPSVETANPHGNTRDAAE
jgi:hypothetical protein